MIKKLRRGMLVGGALIISSLACGLSGSLSTFLFLPPLLTLGILWLAFVVNRRIFGCILIGFLFIPMTVGGIPIIFLFIPPIFFLTLLYLIATVYFLLHKKPKKFFDLAIFFTCFALLLPPSVLNIPSPGYYIWVPGNLQSTLLSAFRNATLEVQVLAPDGSPVSDLEVDLWLASTEWGPPDAGRQRTDAGGIATFGVIAGNYRIGFNMLNFPKDYIPSSESVGLSAGERLQKVIRLRSKG